MNPPEDLDDLRRKHYNATIIGERIHHGTVMVIRVRPDAAVPEPEPGQWLELGLGIWEPVMEGAQPGSTKRVPPNRVIRRAYSLSSPILTPDHSRLLEPKEWEGFEFFLSLVVPPAERAGRVPNLTGRLFCLKPEDRLLISDQPMGEYTLAPVSPRDNVLFLATGTGEAPHNMMVWELLRRNRGDRVTSIVSVRYVEDLAYDPVHRRLTELFPRYRYEAVATREPESDGRHLQELLLDGTIERMAGFSLDPSNTRIYLCGNPGMIGPPRVVSGKRILPEDTGLVELLERRGFNTDQKSGGEVNLHFERYW